MNKYTTSQGHNFSTGNWLDLHFDACKLEYELMVRSIGIQPGWRVLDAGCGNGRFLNVFSELVSPSGEIYAIDLAKENIVIVQDSIKSIQFGVPIYASIGNVTMLDFPDNFFDLVWCANVTQYLDNNNLAKAINEIKRVLKRGGYLAIKEADGSSYFFYPTQDITLLWDSVKKMNQQERQRWFDHPLEMKLLLEKFDFHETKQLTHLVERRFPLDIKTLKYLARLFELEDVNWSAIEIQTPKNQQEWKRILDKNSPYYILSQPNFYWREGHIVAIGKK